MSSGTYPAHRTALQKRGNPNWGKPGAPEPAKPTAFEFLVARQGIANHPELWEDSAAVKMWVKRNRSTRYVPEFLLERWGWKDEVEGAA